MRTPLFLATFLAAFIATPSGAQVPDADYQIAAAEMALPTALKEKAGVFGHVDSVDDEMQELRSGDDLLVCRVGRIEGERLNVFCLPESMQPLMKRFRELRDGGMEFDEATETLQAEIKDGQLATPPSLAIGYAYRGADGSYGQNLDEVKQHASRWQLVMTPFATAEKLNLPDKPEGSMPWLMAAGTGFAHIMVYGDPAANLEP